MGPELRKRSSTVQINLASVVGCDHSGRICSTHQTMTVAYHQICAHMLLFCFGNASHMFTI